MTERLAAILCGLHSLGGAPHALDGLTRGAVIAAATFVSEDITCVAAGLLIRAHQLSWPVAVAGCSVGIFLGDLGLWLIGRVVGRRAFEWPWMRRRLPEGSIERISNWIDDRGWRAVVASRFLPGTRLPFFVAAGAFGRQGDRFIIWALLGTLVWTPPVVLLVALLGDAIAVPLTRIFGLGWLTLLAGGGLILLMLRVAVLASTQSGRARLGEVLARIRAWEFWPAWIFYLPIAPWVGWLALRHGGLTTATAANPGILHGGVVGESKFGILSKLPPQWTVDSDLVPMDDPGVRLARLRTIVRERGWSYPIVLKPDAGQRGVGVKLIADEPSAAPYLAGVPEPLVAQRYHPGPYEAGIFYYRRPSEPRGRIFSITDKQFPSIVGDGISSIESIIRRHPRFRMQAATFLSRLNGRAGQVPDAGKRIPLAVAGNHCQGTLFRDGAHLWSPALETAIDRIARAAPGFYFGRFDIRYAEADDLRRGEKFEVIELNGALSESTNIYDPDSSLFQAYAVLYRQWSLLFEIGAANRRCGVRSSKLADVIFDAAAYYRGRSAPLVSD